MKRTLTITLTVALVGSLMFMGFAGTAAAQDIDIGAITGESGDATNNADVDQTNNNAQVGISNAEAAAAGADNGADNHHDKYKNGDGTVDAFAGAESSVTQAQDVDQTNTADVDQTATTGDAAGIALDVVIELLDGNGNGAT